MNAGWFQFQLPQPIEKEQLVQGTKEQLVGFEHMHSIFS